MILTGRYGGGGYCYCVAPLIWKVVRLAHNFNCWLSGARGRRCASRRTSVGLPRAGRRDLSEERAGVREARSHDVTADAVRAVVNGHTCGEKVRHGRVPAVCTVIVRTALVRPTGSSFPSSRVKGSWYPYAPCVKWLGWTKEETPKMRVRIERSTIGPRLDNRLDA